MGGEGGERDRRSLPGASCIFPGLRQDAGTAIRLDPRGEPGMIPAMTGFARATILGNCRAAIRSVRGNDSRKGVES